MEQVPEDAVGRQVLCDGERATVRYVGTVPPTTGECLPLHAISRANTCFFPALFGFSYLLNSLQSHVPMIAGHICIHSVI